MSAICRGLLLSEVISQAAPTLCIKAPTSEAKSAISRFRNRGAEEAATDFVSRHACSRLEAWFETLYRCGGLEPYESAGFPGLVEEGDVRKILLIRISSSSLAGLARLRLQR